MHSCNAMPRPSVSGRRYSAFESFDFSPSPSALSCYFEAADINELPSVAADELIDCPVVVIDGDESVENACKALLDNKANCVVVQGTDGQYMGLFDYADVNAFLVLASNSHNLRPFELADQRIAEILSCAKKGHVPVRLVINLSEKNPLVIVPRSAELLALLGVFSRGTHQVIVEDDDQTLLGIVSDMRLVTWFMTSASTHPGLASVLISPLSALPGIGMQHAVVSASTEDTLLDAMRLLSEQGVSSIAVVDPAGMLLSAVSVRDIGRLVVPSPNKRILEMPLAQFIAIIKAEDGATDGIDKFPVYSVIPTSSLTYCMQKLLATRAHRVFITDDPSCPPSPPVTFAGLPSSPAKANALDSPTTPPMSFATLGNLRGVVSVLDVLSIFARLLGLSDVDPGHAGRHRRASSASIRSRRSRSSPHSSRSSLSLSHSQSLTGADLQRTLSNSTSATSVSGANEPPATRKHVRLSLGNFAMAGPDATAGVQMVAANQGGRITGLTVVPGDQLADELLGTG
ncbi:hypothetical protein BKA62DRAFT_283016 [Auriculariales sp. MPI-PUGE-AT-0066]|nr:hypothetical protein BKA62DRAFT_283016 [Auriculariales sp. MPI-PUGE-AT-0066]